MKNGFATFTQAVMLWVRRFFTTFGLIVLTLSLVGALLNPNNIMFCSQLLWLALFAFLMACTFSVTDFLAKKALGTVLLRAVHFVLSYLSFLLTFVLGGGAESYFKTNSAWTNRIFMVVCMSFLFIGIYAAVSVIRFAWLSLFKRSKQPHEYQRLYSDMDSDKNV